MTINEIEKANDRMRAAYRNAQNLCINPKDENAKWWYDIYLNAKQEYFTLSAKMITHKRQNPNEVKQ